MDPALQADLAQRNEEHQTEWYILVNDAQAEDLASGFVPQAVKAMVRCMLDWRAEDERRAARPVPRKGRPGQTRREQGTP